MERKEFSVDDFLKKLSNFDTTCNSCKFFNSTRNECREKEIIVMSDTPKCDKWRYFA
jgi:hypothetical protein